MVLLAASDAAAGAGGETPPAPVRPFTRSYFDTKVVDGYHWMDDPAGSAELTAWLTAQDAHTRAVLSQLPRSAELRRRTEQLSAATPEIKRLVRLKDRWLYLKRAADANSFKLYVRDGLDGSERLLLDPDAAASDDKHAAIDYFEPSPDGKLVAYGLSVGGSEDSVLHVLDVERGVVLADRIDRARIANPQWRHDGKSFFYRRLQELPPDHAASALYQKARTYLHVVGSDPKSDRVVFGFGVSDRVAVGADDFGAVYTVGGGAWIIGAVTHGVQHEVEVHVAPAASAVAGDIPWRKLAGFDDQVSQLDVHGDFIYLMTHRDGSRGSVVRVALRGGDLAHGEVVVPASDQVLNEIAAASDGLYVRANEGGLGRLWRVPYGRGKKKSAVALPFEGSIASVWTRDNTPGAVFQMQSWVRPPSIYQTQPGHGTSDTGLVATPGIDVSLFESEELKAPSSGGVMVPLSIVRRRGLPLDGKAPTWLSAYGSHGYTADPRFEPRRIAWLELGGIYAVCHARGGGELGEQWHQAGMKLHKQNTIDDVIACAHYLVEHRYTSPAHLGVEGTSAGGLAGGGAMTQQPALFGAAILRVPVVDPIAFEETAGGAGNAKEFGSSKVRDEFAALLAISPYHAVRDGVRYPAVLLMTALNDRRVPPSQAAKMAARLQAATASGKPILLRVERDAGHGGFGSTRAQIDAELADIYAFLWSQLAGDTASADRY